MPIATLLAELSEQAIARNVTIPHDEARLRFVLLSNTTATIDEFFNRIGEYYAYHYSQCVSKGGRMSPSEARSFAKEIVERESRRHRGNLLSSFHNSRDGLSGGLRAVFDQISEALKTQAAENYIRDVFDRHVAPNAWDQKVQIIREILAHWGPYLDADVTASPPEKFASSYEDLVRALSEALKSTSSAFRRL